MIKRSTEEIIKAVERYMRGESMQVAEGKRLGVSKTSFRMRMATQLPNCATF